MTKFIRKNIFVFGFTKFATVEVLRRLKKESINIAYWNGAKKYLIKLLKKKRV